MTNRAIVRLEKNRYCVLCSLGHVIEGGALIAGSMLSAELASRRAGDRFDRMAERCKGKGHSHAD
jgi:hypothetical protein